MRIARLFVAAIAFATLEPVTVGQDLLWDLQFGTTSDDDVGGAVSDGAGGVYLTGSTWGSLTGSSAGFDDPWLARFDAAGNQAWIRQFGFGFDYFESSSFVTVDGAGGAFVGGSRCDALCAFPEGWFARYDSAGNELWSQGVFGADGVLAGAPDRTGGVYVGGPTQMDLGAVNAGKVDAWFARYDDQGNFLWIRQFGTVERDIVLGATPDLSGGVYFCGQLGNTGGPIGHAWFARYDSAGNQMWIRQLSAGSDLTSARAVCSDGVGGVYVGGFTNISLGGQPPVGGTDAFVARYDGAGNEVWTRVFGSTGGDNTESLALGVAGGVFATGVTRTDIGGSSHDDVWLSHFDSAGNLSWTEQLGTSSDDEVAGVASDGLGGVYVGGTSPGSFGGPSAGLSDAWLARFGPKPAAYCTAKQNSCGTFPMLSSTGTPSSTAGSGFVVRAANTKGQRPGLLIYTNSGPGMTPFLGGTLCLNTSTLRRSVAVADTTGTPGQCDGTLSIDMNAFAVGALGGNPAPSLTAPGTRINCQFWGRDTPGSALLSDGLEYFVGM